MSLIYGRLYLHRLSDSANSPLVLLFGFLFFFDTYGFLLVPLIIGGVAVKAYRLGNLGGAKNSKLIYGLLTVRWKRLLEPDITSYTQEGYL